MIRSPLRLLAVPVLLAALLVGGGFAFANDGTAPTPVDTSVISEARQVNHAETVELRLAQEKAEADREAWFAALKKAEDEAKFFAAVAEAERLEAERIAHEEWHREQDRIAAEKAAAAAAAKSKPAAPAAPAPSGGSSAYGAGASAGPCAGWEGTIASYFPASQVSKACSVMMCESGGNPNAKNTRSTASGLFQFLDSTWESTTGTPAPARAYSPSTQVSAAAKLWSSQGWGPWECA